MAPIFILLLVAMVAITSAMALPASLLNHGGGDAAKVRRQNSWMGNAVAGGVRGVFNAGVTMAGDRISQELTGNDRDHPQKSDEELEEERREKDRKEQEEERKKKVEEEDEDEDE